MRTLKFLAPFLLLVTISGLAAGEVQRIEIRSRDDAGTYERLVGRVYYSVDPKLAANQTIADIALAPVTAGGKVEFSGDVLIVRPKDPAKSRGAVFLEVVNRGGPQSLGIMSAALGGDPAPEHWDLGDRFLLDQGFTLVFLGWQFDVTEESGLGLRVPSAPVTGLVRQTYIEDGAGRRYNSLPLSYCAADPDQPDARITLRQKMDEAGIALDRAQWHFMKDGCVVTVNAGFDPGLYEVIYRAKNPAVAGLGLAAIRDFAAYLKYGPKTAPLREDPRSLRRVIGYGYSQSARVLRQLVQDGFNQDERGRAVFDGLMISSAGAGGASVNHRFALPGEAGNSVLSILRPVDLPPFTDDSFLAKAEAAHVTPRIFYTFTSTEYWARAGSLTHTSPDGKTEVPLGPRSRLYFLSGTAHSSGPFPPARDLRGLREEHYTNFAQQRWVTRALILDLDSWIASGVEPPPSRYPSLAKGELVARESVHFPKSPAIPFPDYMPQVWRMDFGPDFATKGIIANEPPVLGAPYTVLVPQVDADGNDLGGIRLPEIAAPLGTFTGWNIRLPRLSSLHYLSGLFGSFEPFPKTREDRESAADARKSIAERYPTRQDYLDQVKRAAQDLVKQRFMLPDDVDAAMRRAASMWDAIAK
jgi:hypothetical protein